MNLRSNRSLTALFVLALMVAVPVAAERAPGDLADVRLGGSSVEWQPQGADHAAVTLTIARPDGEHESFEFAAGEPILFTPDFDGLYSWELRFSPKLSEEARSVLAEARETGDLSQVRAMQAAGTLPQGGVQSGTFEVEAGLLVNPAETEEVFHSAHAAAGLREVTAADQVFLDDVIIDGSLCVGFDCVNGEVFGFDTIRLKENNTRIKFVDTSSSGSFPTTDWELEANDSANGGENQFSIIDVSAGSRKLFKVESGAPNNALVVDSSGRIGVKTVDPVMEIHVADGDTPTLRLQQDGSSGFQQQTYDVAANEANFFVRDVTNGSALVFRLKPGAPGNSIFVAADGDVGLGTDNPSTLSSGNDASLHIRRTDGDASLLVEEANSTSTGRTLLELKNNGNVNFRLNNSDSGDIWQILADNCASSSSGFSLSLSGSGNREFRVDCNGDVYVNGSIVHSSSRTVKDHFVALEPREILERVVELPITEWSYTKDGKAVRHIGPMAEDFFASFGLGSSNRYIADGDTSGVALAAIQGLNEKVQAKDAELEALRERLAALEAQLTRSDEE